MNHSLTTAEAFLAMRIFLDQYFERGGCQSDDIAALLSGLSRGIWEDGSTNDPAQRKDWLDAVQAALSRKNPTGFPNLSAAAGAKFTNSNQNALNYARF